jgi:hypothetical protein
MARLEIRYSDGLVETKELVRERSFTIGSDPRCDLRLDGEAIQPRHCVIRWVDRRFRLDADPNAKNVFVGVNPVSKLRLKPDSEFSIGDVEFRVRYETDEIGAVQVRPEESAGAEGPPHVPLYRSRTFFGVVAALVLLAGVGVGLYVMVQASGAERTFDAARRDLNDRLYAKAMSGFDRFLEKYPANERAPEAAYLRARARVEQYTTASPPAWSNAFDAARSMVAEVGRSAPFRQRPAETADLLAGIAEGLAEQARDRSDPALLERSEEALALLNESVSKDAAPAEQIQRIRAVQEEARFAVSKSSEIAEAVAQLQASLEQSRFAEFHRRYASLMHRHADARDDARIKRLLRQSAELQTRSVRFAPPGAARSAGPLAALPAWTRYGRSGGESQAAGAIAPVHVADVLYGVDSGDGSVRWRTVVGYPVAFPALHPPLPAPWILAYRESTNELLLLDPSNGRTAARLALSGLRPRSRCEAVVHQDHVYIVARPEDEEDVGVVFVAKVAGGGIEEVGRYVFPQPILAPPAVDGARNSLLAVGEQGVLYQVQLSTQSCERVVALGHEAGAIRTKPVMAGRFLLLAESQGLDASRLRCWVVSESDGSMVERPSLPLSGDVEQAPIVRMGRVFAATNKGRYYVAELGAETDDRPLTKGAEYSDVEAGDARAPLLLAPNDQELWVLGETARKYLVRVDQGALEPQRDVPLEGWAMRDSTFPSGRVFAAAEDRRNGGVRVVSIDPGSVEAAAVAQLGRLPLALSVGPDGAIRIVDADGVQQIALTDLAQDAIVARPAQSDAASADRERRSVFGSDDAGVFLYGESEVVFAPVQGGRQVAWSVPGGVGGAPVPCGEGALVPSKAGFVYWVDPRESRELSDPFAAPVRNGRPAEFTAVAAADPQSPAAGAFAAAGANVFKLVLADSPARAWVRAAEVETGGEPVRRMAVQNGLLWCGRDSGVLVLDAASLERRGELEIRAGRNAWAVGPDSILLSSPDGSLASLGVDGGVGGPVVRWRQTLPAEPAGPPAIHGKSAWIALPDGTAVELDLESGRESLRLSFGRAVAAGPYRVPQGLVVVAADGSLCRLPLPD